MDWFIKQTFVCPNTGTAFALATCMRNLKLILWYRGDYFLREGNILSTSPYGLIVNGKERELVIMHAFPFSSTLWTSFRNNIHCPGNNHPFIRECAERWKCLFENCPYGISKEQ
ncbi:anti-adapter protein IraM [Cedecea colo]|uniref:Anti-adapter protein IraM n=1 Tax=Cedecea colo TaxID=2552946 RepID=A0ABX0VM96_9ENTR|nr:anti-adapter protein IraM [Cedecea colo]NIY47455.1 anti-adapter protein IraM [Cedecea colo]